MVSLVNSHTNATIIGWHLWEIDLRFAHGLPPGRAARSQHGSDMKHRQAPKLHPPFLTPIPPPRTDHTPNSAKTR